MLDRDGTFIHQIQSRCTQIYRPAYKTGGYWMEDLRELAPLHCDNNF